MTLEITIGDGGIDWPAWVQAVGSIVAILVSVAIAVWVPIHARSAEGKDAADRALLSLVAASRLEIAAWRGLDIILSRKKFRPYTAAFVRAQITQVRSLLAAAPIHCLGSAANAAVNHLSLQAAHLELLVSGLPEGASGDDARVAIRAAIQELSEELTELESMRLVKVHGHWIADTPPTAASRSR